jgi:hypothetical protein
MPSGRWLSTRFPPYEFSADFVNRVRSVGSAGRYRIRLSRFDLAGSMHVSPTGVRTETDRNTCLALRNSIRRERAAISLFGSGTVEVVDASETGNGQVVAMFNAGSTAIKYSTVDPSFTYEVRFDPVWTPPEPSFVIGTCVQNPTRLDDNQVTRLFGRMPANQELLTEIVHKLISKALADVNIERPQEVPPPRPPSRENFFCACEERSGRYYVDYKAIDLDSGVIRVVREELNGPHRTESACRDGMTGLTLCARP